MMSQENDILAKINGAVSVGDYTRVSEIIEDIVGRQPQILSRGFGVWFAKLVILAGKWDLVEMMLPKGTNALATSGWLKSLSSGAPVDAQGCPLPWLTYPAIDFIEPRINQNWRVFEWGSGYSTLWWSRKVSLVQSIENNADWFRKVKGMAGANCVLQHFSDCPDYVNAILSSPHAPFDVICIDGVMRPECAEVALRRISPKGIIVVDNSDVEDHERGLLALMEAGWKRIDFFGLIPAYPYKNCTSIFYIDDSVVTINTLPSQMSLSSGPTCTQALTAR